jgi:hypothetical protein
MVIHTCISTDLERKSLNIYRSEKYIPKNSCKEKRNARFIYNTLFVSFTN